MIIVSLKGGHSNQLFQYAIGRRLAIKHGTDLKLDLTWFDSTANHSRTHVRFYELKDYPIHATIASRDDLSRVEQSTKRGLLSTIIGRGKNPAIHKIVENGLSINKAALNAPDNSYIDGYWQNEAYFKDIRSHLVKEFEPKKAMTKKNLAYLNQIQAGESVSLHVRREDYVDHKESHAFHGLMGMDYYNTALEIMSKKLKNRKFRVFIISKEIEWCKKNLKINYPTTFIEGNTSGSDDMRLMKHCSHNILANSSFSWWGAWLNQNPNKIVVAPKVWFQDETANNQMELPPSWIRL